MSFTTELVGATFDSTPKPLLVPRPSGKACPRTNDRASGSRVFRRVARLGDVAPEAKHGVGGVLRRQNLAHGLAQNRARAVHEVVHGGVVREAGVEHLAPGAVQRGFAKPA